MFGSVRLVMVCTMCIGSVPRAWERVMCIGSVPCAWERAMCIGSVPRAWERAMCIGSVACAWERAMCMGACHVCYVRAISPKLIRLHDSTRCTRYAYHHSVLINKMYKIYITSLRTYHTYLHASCRLSASPRQCVGRGRDSESIPTSSTSYNAHASKFILLSRHTPIRACVKVLMGLL